MSKLRTYLENYIHDLQMLKAQHSKNDDLLDAAEDKWGVKEPRYLILLEKPKPRFLSQSGQPEPEVPKSEDEPNELIDWLPDYLDTLQGLLQGAADDPALEREAAKKWMPKSYGHKVVEAGQD